MKRHKFTRAQRRRIEKQLQKEARRKIKDIKVYNRLLVLQMRSMDKTNKEISELLGYSVQYITELVSKYIKEGIDFLLTDKRTGNNRNMTFDQECAFLEDFAELANAGQLTTITPIMEKYKEVTGKDCCDTTIYRLLKRHGWRKLKPRPAHPGKASEEAIAASKKLTQHTGGYWQKLPEIEIIGA